MPLKFALYPGCAAKGATPELINRRWRSSDASASRSLNWRLRPVAEPALLEKRTRTCPSLNARTFAQAERMGLDVMTICGTCQGDERRQSPPEE